MKHWWIIGSVIWSILKRVARAVTRRKDAPVGLLNFSKRAIARRAITYARNHKDEFIALVNAKLDVPMLSEAQEARTMAVIVDTSLAALETFLDGGTLGDIMISKRGLVVSAAEFAAENVDDFLGAGFDVPGVPETIEVWAGNGVAEFLKSVVIPWAKTTPLLD